MTFRSLLSTLHNRMSSRSPPAGTKTEADASGPASTPSSPRLDAKHLKPPSATRSFSPTYSRRAKSHSPAPLSRAADQTMTPPASREVSKTRKVRRMRVQVPLYIYPTATAWAPLFTAIAAHRDLQFDIVVNPANGPGSTPLPDANYIQQMTRLRAHPNVTVYGYVHVSWAERSLEAVQADIRTYQGWNLASTPDCAVHIDGVFVDEAPWHERSTGYMSSLAAYVRRTLTRGTAVWTNPGCPVAVGYYNHADRITAFEASFADWSDRGGFLQGFEGGAKEKRKTSVMVHSCPRDKVAEVLASCREEGADGVFVTDLKGYEGWGRGWAEWVRVLADEVDAAT